MADTKDKILYLVVRNTDTLPDGEYGVSEDFRVVFASMDKDKAEQAKLGAEYEVDMHNTNIDLDLMNKAQKVAEQSVTDGRIFPPVDVDATFDHMQRHYTDKYSRCTFSIVEVNLDTYYDREQEPLLGSSWYIE